MWSDHEPAQEQKFVEREVTLHGEDSDTAPLELRKGEHTFSFSILLP